MHMIHKELAPGQRYIQSGASAGQPDQMVTIARLDRDRFGVPLVTFLLPDGRDLTTYADQIEAAIADGALTAAESQKSEVRSQKYGVRERELQSA